MKSSSSSASAKKAEKADFADQLFGAKSGKLEGPDSRTERKENPGRESEGNRSAEREKQADSSREAEYRTPKKSEGKAERKSVHAKKESPKTEAHEASTSNTENRQVIADGRPMAPVNDRPVDTDEGVETDSLEEPKAPQAMKAQPAQSASQASAKVQSAQDLKASSALPNQGATPPVGQQPKMDGVKLPDFAKPIVVTPPQVAVDPLAEQTEKSVELMAGMQTQELDTRQKAMSEFLTKMQKELGVPPDKVLQAFSEMDLDELAESPQNTVGAFVQGLSLDPAGQVKAADLYKTMLDKRGETILPEKLATLDDDVTFDIASKQDIKLRELDKSLDQLNMSFFRKDGAAQNPEEAQKALESMDAQISKLMREKPEKTTKKGGLSEVDPKAMASTGAAANMFAADTADDADASSPGSSATGSTLSAMTSSAGEMPKLAEFGGSGSQAQGDMLGGQSQQSNAQAAQAAATPQSDFKDSVTKEMKTADKKVTSVRGEQAVDTAQVSSTPAANAGQAAAPKAPVGAAGAGTGAASMMMGRQPTAADEQQNIREMVKQAQVMLKRGGGEMKIQMTPEGMGQVHLKVTVENGQVNVQMLTESDSAKRLLEKGLGDLKSSMAAHQLKVENVKVDVGQEIQKHMDQQASQEHARNFAREFMQQQRDDRQDMRSGYFEPRGIAQYGGNRRATIEPEAVQARSMARSAGSGRSLNLVA